jgi:potassium channel
MKADDSLGDNTSEHDDDANVLTVAAMGNSGLLEDLLRAGKDADVGDAMGRTALVSEHTHTHTHTYPGHSASTHSTSRRPRGNSGLLCCWRRHLQHIAASKGYEDCVLVLLKHACNANIRDAQGNTAMWNAIAAGHHKIFNILYHSARASNPHAGGDVMCLATRRGDLDALRELLKLGLDVDSEDHDGATALRVAMAEGHADAARFLITNGASVDKASLDDDGSGSGAARLTMSPTELHELLQKRELVHSITITDSPPVVPDGGSSGHSRPGRLQSTGSDNTRWPRVSIYRGHPFLRNRSSEAGKLINLPATMEEFIAVVGRSRKHTTSFS